MTEFLLFGIFAGRPGTVGEVASRKRIVFLLGILAMILLVTLVAVVFV